MERFRAEGHAGMADRSSQPKTSPRRTEAAVADAIAALRRQRLTGMQIARETGKCWASEPDAIQQRIVRNLRVVEGRALETNLLRAPAKPAGGSRREFCTLKT